MFPVIFYFCSSLFMTLFMIGPPRRLPLAAAAGGTQHGQRQDGQTSSLRRHVPVQDGQEDALQVSLLDRAVNDPSRSFIVHRATLLQESMMLNGLFG